MLGFPLSFYWLSGVNWIRMWVTDFGWNFWPSQPQFYPGVQCGSHNFVDLSCVNMHCCMSVASAVYKETANSFTKDHDRREIELSCNSAHTQAQGRNWYDWWHYNRVCPSERYTSRPLLVTSLMASLFYPFFLPSPVCTLQITLEMGKINNYYCIFLRLYLTKMSWRKCRRWHFRDPKFKHYLGGACLQTTPGLGRQTSLPACTFKISRYAADYRCFIGYEFKAQF